jgi:predicted nucleotidyltransferase
MRVHSTSQQSLVAGKNDAAQNRKEEQAMGEDLQTLAETLAQWIDAAPGVPAIYLFGSRVRGDHRLNSDVDVRVFLNEWKVSDGVTIDWWTKQNETDFAELKPKLPGSLHIHRETTDAADENIRKGMKNPVLTVGKAVCVWTPRVKPSHRT